MIDSISMFALEGGKFRAFWCVGCVAGLLAGVMALALFFLFAALGVMGWGQALGAVIGTAIGAGFANAICAVFVA